MVECFCVFGVWVEVIELVSFNYGGMWCWVSQQVEVDVLIYLIQDVIFVLFDSFVNLFDEFYVEVDIGVVYGCQLLYFGVGLFGVQVWCFNYLLESCSKCLVDVLELGIKICFSFDLFFVYCSDVLVVVGGFFEDVIGSEDVYVVVCLLQVGYVVCYVVSVEVYYFYDYCLLEEFCCYFDIGVFYGCECWICVVFGGVGGEGKCYVFVEIQVLCVVGVLYCVFEIVLCSVFKLFGYCFGQLECYLLVVFKCCISMFLGYWK